MLTVSSTDVAIAAAHARGTLSVSREFSPRFGDHFYAIADEHGLIEVALSEDEARERVASVTAA